MYISLDPNSPQPLFEQLHDAIVSRILSGELQPGEQLDSVRKVAARFGINPATVKKAYDLLQRNGLVTTSQRSGTTIMGIPAGGISDQAQQELAQSLGAKVRLGLAQGIPPDALRTLIDTLINESSPRPSNQQKGDLS